MELSKVVKDARLSLFMLQVPPFYWQNIITIVLLGILLLPAAAATLSLILGLYFRGRGGEAALHFLFFAVVAGRYGLGAWDPPGFACDHTSYCWQYPGYAVLLAVQCVVLFFRFLYLEQAAANREDAPKTRKGWFW